jgi:hypothetical protein
MKLRQDDQFTEIADKFNEMAQRVNQK